MVVDSYNLTDHVVQVVDDDLRVVAGIHGAVQEGRPRAELGFLQQARHHFQASRLAEPFWERPLLRLTRRTLVFVTSEICCNNSEINLEKLSLYWIPRTKIVWLCKLC